MWKRYLDIYEHHDDIPSTVKGNHDHVTKWGHFPRYWPFVRGIHRSTVSSPHKAQWRGALIFSLICALINGWVINNGKAGDLTSHRAHYDVIVMDYSNAMLIQYALHLFHHAALGFRYLQVAKHIHMRITLNSYNKSARRFIIFSILLL